MCIPAVARPLPWKQSSWTLSCLVHRKALPTPLPRRYQVWNQRYLRKVLDGIAVPRLSKCRECLTFHLLRHRCQSLTSALSTLTSSTAQLPPIGHSLQSANSTLQKLEVMYHFYEDSLPLFVYPLYSVKMPFVD